MGGDGRSGRSSSPQEHGMPQAEAWRAWKPILTFCSRDEGWLQQALDLFFLCTSPGRSRLTWDRAPWCHPITGIGPQGADRKQEGCDAQLQRGEGSGR